MTDINRLIASLKRRSAHVKEFGDDITFVKLEDLDALVEALEKAQQVDEDLCKLLPPGAEYMDPPDGGDVTPLEGVRRMVADYRQRIAELESRTVTVKPDDADEVREEGNQFLVVRHPGKVPVIKHPVGQLEDYLLQILKADPLATIDIVTHRYYGVGGQFVEDADEYLHE
ncbi:TPA: hypothetical protein ACIJ1I_002301, partial [Klebsiella aerogenes]